MSLLDTSGLQDPTFTDMRRLLDAVGGIHREAAAKRFGAILHALVGLITLQAAAIEVIGDNRVSRLASVGRVPATLPTDALSAGLLATDEGAARPKSGDRAKRLRANREAEAAQAKAVIQALGQSGPAKTSAARSAGVSRTPAVVLDQETAKAQTPAGSRRGKNAGASADSSAMGSSIASSVASAVGAGGGVVHRQIRPGRPLTKSASAEGVPDIDLLPPGQASGGLALVRSVYRENGLTTSLLSWRPAAFGPREVTILRLYHPSVAWAIEPVHPAPGGVTGRVLDLLLTGLPEKEIARRLNRSTHTVHAHVKRVYRHYGVRSRSELIVRHFRHHDEA